jgi:predicted Fe-Mo cluster-binding NifX family protein
MKIAIPIWQGNVSSVFDFAHNLLLVELEKGVEKSRQEVSLAEQSGPERATKVRQLGVDALVCGAISRPLAYMLSSSGIEVLPFITGSTEQILDAYKTGQLYQPQYALPGYWEGARRCFRRRRGRRGRKW